MEYGTSVGAYCSRIKKHLARQLAVGVILRAAQNPGRTKPLGLETGRAGFDAVFFRLPVGGYHNAVAPSSPPTHTGRLPVLDRAQISQLAKNESPSMCKMRLLRALIAADTLPHRPPPSIPSCSQGESAKLGMDICCPTSTGSALKRGRLGSPSALTREFYFAPFRSLHFCCINITSEPE